ncbi:MAG: glycine cleavage system protein GcvH [Duncaniella sp.]|nr:glycine cleavage system protein GcvH [Duncaniella sp.]
MKTYYSSTHEYIRVDGNIGFIGITDYAQKSLGNIVYVDMPDIDDEVVAGEDFGAVESVKAASDLIAPASGSVIEINEALVDNPRLLNENPVEQWIIKIELADASQLSELMTEEEYLSKL